MQTDPIQISNVNIYLLKHKQPGELTFMATKRLDNSFGFATYCKWTTYIKTCVQKMKDYIHSDETLVGTG